MSLVDDKCTRTNIKESREHQENSCKKKVSYFYLFLSSLPYSPLKLLVVFGIAVDKQGCLMRVGMANVVV